MDKKTINLMSYNNPPEHADAITELGYRFVVDKEMARFVRISFTYSQMHNFVVCFKEELLQQILEELKNLGYPVSIIHEHIAYPVYVQNLNSEELYLVGMMGDDYHLLESFNYFSMFDLDHRLRHLVGQWAHPSQVAAEMIDYGKLIEEFRTSRLPSADMAYKMQVDPMNAVEIGLEMMMKNFALQFAQVKQPNEIINYHFTHFRYTARIIEENIEFVPNIYSRIVQILFTIDEKSDFADLWRRLDVSSLKEVVRQLGKIENGFLRSTAKGLLAHHLTLQEENGCYKLALTEEYWEDVKKHSGAHIDYKAKAIEVLLPFRAEIITNFFVGHKGGKQGVCPVNIKHGERPHIYDLFTQFAYDLLCEVYKTSKS